MPNWCDNELTIQGSSKRVNECLTAISDGENPIDFRRIVPMPTILAETDAPTEWWVLFLLDAMEEMKSLFLHHHVAQTLRASGCNDDANVEAFLEKSDSVSELKDMLKRQHPDWEQRCSSVKHRLEQTGFSNWYDWCVSNWGTKWNTDGYQVTFYEFGENSAEAEVCFATAWSPPLPIIKALGEKYPDLTFRLIYYESGEGFHGLCRMENGQVTTDVRGDYYGDSGG